MSKSPLGVSTWARSKGQVPERERREGRGEKKRHCEEEGYWNRCCLEFGDNFGGLLTLGAIRGLPVAVAVALLQGKRGGGGEDEGQMGVNTRVFMPPNVGWGP